MSDFPAFKTFDEWIAAGYNWHERRCNREGCGLPVIEFYLPNDLPFRVDPVTHGRHIDVCGNKERVREMKLASERSEPSTPGLDWKQRQSGER
jgi:hypothetical protein